MILHLYVFWQSSYVSFWIRTKVASYVLFNFRIKKNKEVTSHRSYKHIYRTEVADGQMILSKIENRAAIYLNNGYISV